MLFLLIQIDALLFGAGARDRLQRQPIGWTISTTTIPVTSFVIGTVPVSVSLSLVCGTFRGCIHHWPSLDIVMKGRR